MQGRDKGLVNLAGRPLIVHALTRLRPQVGQVLINANRHIPTYAGFGPPVIIDDRLDYPGPLAGLAAGLATAPTAYLLTTPCDTPWLPLDLRQRLSSALLEAGTDVAVAHDGERLQPLFALLHRRVGNDLRASLEGGHRSVAAWLERQSVTVVSYTGQASAFANINRLGELNDSRQ